MDDINYHRKSAKRMRENFSPVKQLLTMLNSTVYERFNPTALYLISISPVEDLDDTFNNDGYNCLHMTVKIQNLLVLISLIEKGVNVNQISRHSNVNPGFTAIMIIIKNIRDHSDKTILLMIKMLVDGGADVNFSIGKDTILSIAFTNFINGRGEEACKIVYFLLKSGADPNFCMGNGGNALFAMMFWPEHMIWQMIQTLITFKVDLNRKCNRGFSFVSYIGRPSLRLIELIIKEGWDFNLDSIAGSNYIEQMSKKEDPDFNYNVIRYLLKVRMDGFLTVC